METKWTLESLRKFEKNLADSFERGEINCPLHLCGGNEEQLIRIFKDIKSDDYVFSTHRNHYHYLLKGGDENKLLDEIKGLESGVCNGKGRSMHIYDRKINFFTSGIVAGSCAIAVGVAMALKKKESIQHVWCFVGDGAEDSGHFIEAVRFGSARQLPLTFIVEDNDMSIDSSKKERWHNYMNIVGRNIIKYEYKRIYPHVGIGKWVSF
jgi:TPP-dependent pyruvate/acetoin dehydrogenase alpha subunit